MAELFSDRPFPRSIVFAGGGLMLAALVAAGTARFTDRGVTRLPDTAAHLTRAIVFADRDDGAVLITEPNGDMVAVLPGGGDGFVRGVMRGFARDRKARGVGPEAPFELVRRVDGRLTLIDPATGRIVELDAFGPTNSGAFARLLTARETRP